jgi:hypothetical protein
LKEWEEARSVLKDYDAHLHDLRKIGFTFITALLAGESLLLPSTLLQTGLQDVTKILPDETKFAVLLVTLLLVLALQFIDRNYQVIEGAASKRAIVLEKKLNLELTNTIFQRFRAHKVKDFVTFIYYAFVAAVLIIGAFALSPVSVFFWILFVSAGASSYGLHYVLEQTVKPPYPYGIVDWTLDPINCKIGDEVEITLTNLSNDEKPQTYPAHTIMWEIVKEGEANPVKTEIAQKPIQLDARNTYTWLWKAGEDLNGGVKFEPGIYRLYRVTLDKKGSPIPPKPCKMIRLRINQN